MSYAVTFALALTRPQGSDVLASGAGCARLSAPRSSSAPHHGLDSNSAFRVWRRRQLRIGVLYCMRAISLRLLDLFSDRISRLCWSKSRERRLLFALAGVDNQASLLPLQKGTRNQAESRFRNQSPSLASCWRPSLALQMAASDTLHRGTRN